MFFAYATYGYDTQNQLRYENNRAANASYEYIYDAYGNITSVKQGTYGSLPENTVKTFSYSGDKLTNYNGSVIYYDLTGNPRHFTYNDYGYNLSWEDGRRLSSTTVNTVTTDYRYNADGIRTQKGDIQYIVDGARILAEKRSDRTIYYAYDESGDVVGFTQKLSSGAVEAYYYVKNLQGDVTELLDYKLDTVAEYSYNAWGEVISVTDSSGNAITDMNHIANINPFRYRSYYYDIETGFYYCGSRYYNPVFCRWINADDTEIMQEDQDNMLQYNLYAYCFNNPVNMVDDDGYLPKWVTKIAVGATAIAIGVGVTALTGGAALPALVAGVKAACVAGAISAGTSAATTTVRSAVSGDSFSTIVKKSAGAAVNGFADGFMAGGIAAGASQVASGGFKIVAKLGAKTGKSGGIKIGNTKILSPDAAWHKNNGGTLLKVGNTFRIDVGSNTLLHMHLSSVPSHIQIGTICAGIYGGLK